MDKYIIRVNLLRDPFEGFPLFVKK